MNDNKFDNIGLADTMINCPYLPEDKIVPQRFHSHFMSQQLDSTTTFNRHDSLPGPYQHGGTSSITTGNIIVRRTELGRDK